MTDEREQSEGEVELTYVSVVQQSTGERWEDAGLSLSTARPSLAAMLPELDPWYLNVYTPPVPRSMSAAKSRIISTSGLPGDQQAYSPTQSLMAPAMAFPDEATFHEDQAQEEQPRHRR